MKSCLLNGIAAFVALWLVGCTTTGTTQIADASAQLTAGTAQPFDTLKPVEVKFPDDGKDFFDMGNIAEPPSGVIPYSDGERSFARLYKLPQWNGVYRIVVQSRTMGTLTDPALFYPRISFFDASFKQTRHTNQKDFTFRVQGETGLVSTEIWINEQNRTEAYALVSSEPRAQVKEEVSPLQSSGHVPIIVPIGPVLVMWQVPTGGTELPRAMRASANGVTSFRAIPYKDRKITAN